MPAERRSDDAGGILAGTLLLLSVLLFLGVLLGAFLTVRPDVAVLFGFGPGTGPRVFLLFGAAALGAFLLVWGTSGGKRRSRPEDPMLRRRPGDGPVSPPPLPTRRAPALPRAAPPGQPGRPLPGSGRSPVDPLPADAPAPREPGGGSRSTQFEVVQRHRAVPADMESIFGPGAKI